MEVTLVSQMVSLRLIDVKKGREEQMSPNRMLEKKGHEQRHTFIHTTRSKQASKQTRLKRANEQKQNSLSAPTGKHQVS